MAREDSRQEGLNSLSLVQSLSVARFANIEFGTYCIINHSEGVIYLQRSGRDRGKHREVSGCRLPYMRSSQTSGASYCEKADLNRSPVAI